jgi:hypothetical protein
MSGTPKLLFERQSGCLVVRVRTRDFIDRQAETFQAIADGIKAQPVRATLVDLREVPGPLTFMDRYRVGESTGRFLTGLVIAALVREDQADQERIGKLVAKNRGAPVEVFVDPAEADAWLKQHFDPA